MNLPIKPTPHSSPPPSPKRRLRSRAEILECAREFFDLYERRSLTLWDHRIAPLLTLVGLSYNTWADYLKKSRDTMLAGLTDETCGERLPPWIYHEYVRLMGRECDYCGHRGRESDFRGRYEMFNGSQIVMSFCTDSDCEARWDEEETQTQVTIEQIKAALLRLDGPFPRTRKRGGW